MKFMTAMTANLCLLFSTSLSPINAAPVTIRDVFVPPILTPAEGDIWLIGQNRTVTWDVTAPPSQITNKLGKIMLRKGEYTLNVTLAKNFEILSGSVNVTVPSVTPGNDYHIVLFGDSGNWGLPFSIQESCD